MAEKNGNKTVGVRFPKPLLEAMTKYIEKDTHISSSEFVRAAVREKLKRDGNGILDKVVNKEKYETEEE